MVAQDDIKLVQILKSVGRPDGEHADKGLNGTISACLRHLPI